MPRDLSHLAASQPVSLGRPRDPMPFQSPLEIRVYEPATDTGILVGLHLYSNFTNVLTATVN